MGLFEFFPSPASAGRLIEWKKNI